MKVHTEATFEKLITEHLVLHGGYEPRALVHFALDTDEVWMTTRLRGLSTRFLPFNRGHSQGTGNPPVEGKHRTGYLWEEVWQRDSLLDLVGRFIHLQVEKRTDPNTGKTTTTEKMIFPRYHQMDCVRRLVGAAREQGAGQNYLVQHSAGSGKSNSIAWPPCTIRRTARSTTPWWY